MIDKEPIALAREAAHGPVIHDVNQIAARLGLQRGSRITDMRTLVPHLQVVDAQLEADIQDLTRLVHWAQRWSPWTQRDGTQIDGRADPHTGIRDGLFLDTTGCDHLFGGEAAMLEDMRTRFAALDLTARIAIAPTIGAAWALARYSPSGSIIPCQNSSVPTEQPLLAEALSSLPVAALRLDTDTITLLRRLGLKTIGQLLDVPKNALLRRFRKVRDHVKNPHANNPVVRLDQAMGKLAEPLVPVDEHVPVRVVKRLIEPVVTVEALEEVLRALTADLCALMTAQGVGARQLIMTGFRVDGLPVEAHVSVSEASRDPQHLAGLFKGRLEGLDAGFGIDAAALTATMHEPFAHRQDRFDGAAHDALELSQLLDRLMAKLGPQGVRVAADRGSHVPERACVLVSPLASPLESPLASSLDGHTDNLPGAASASASFAKNPVRRDDVTPLRLLPAPERVQVVHAVPDGPPAQMVWRRVAHRLVKAQGPERIAPEWWQEKSSARLRDYYRVEDADGRRYWLYREGLVGDGRGETPDWFLHGIDA